MNDLPAGAVLSGSGWIYGSPGSPVLSWQPSTDASHPGDARDIPLDLGANLLVGRGSHVRVHGLWTGRALVVESLRVVDVPTDPIVAEYTVLQRAVADWLPDTARSHDREKLDPQLITNLQRHASVVSVKNVTLRHGGVLVVAASNTDDVVGVVPERLVVTGGVVLRAASWTNADLDRAQAEIMGLPEADILSVGELTNRDGVRALHLKVVLVSQETRQLQGRYPTGLMHVDAWMHADG